jgi:hypothetical protein
MTREEIIRSFQYAMTNAFIEWDEAVNTEYNEDNEKAFYEGAYAAQKYLIEKTCKWLKENVNKYSYVLKVEDTKYMEVHFTDSLIEDFKAVMEE